jgi:glycolate oxidase FAD binding subunit
MAQLPPLPAPLDQMRQRILQAVAQRTPLRIQGGGSKAFLRGAAGTTGVAVTPAPATLLDTRAWQGITSYEPSELVITARAGTPLAELEAVLAAHGQCLAFEPPHFGPIGGTSPATVGGMVAAGLSGPARASVGAVRDFVLGLQMINGKGEHLRFGGQVMKNVAGYDVSRLMVGSLGTLGLITEVSLKVLPLPAAQASLAFALPQGPALAQLHRWGGQPLPLNASGWGRNLLLLRLQGAKAAVQAACQRLLAQLPGQHLDAPLADAHWQGWRHQQLPFFTQPPQAGMALWRLSLPQTAPVLELPWPQWVEWHGALRWLWAPAGDTTPALAAKQVGGHATIFIANYAARTRANGQFDVENPALNAIQRRLQAEFDPAGIFNPDC